MNLSSSTPTTPHAAPLPDWVQPVCELLVQPGTAYFFWVLILAGTGLALWYLRRHAAPLQKELDEALRAVDATPKGNDFSKSFEELRTEFERLPNLCHLWSEFEETLDVRHDKLGVERVFNTRPANEFFHPENVAAERASSRVVSAAPNLLVGIGIFGTFLGLAAGVQLVAPALRNAQSDFSAAIGDLLGGAFLAFSKSALAILCSVVLTLFERYAHGSISERFERLSGALDARLTLQTPERLAYEQLEQLQEQTDALKRFRDDIAPAIAEALETRVGHALAPALQSLLDAIRELRVDRENSNEKMLSHIVEEFRQSMTSAAGSELKEMARSVGQLQTVLARTSEAIESSQRHAEASNTRLTEGLEQTLELVRTGIRGELESLSHNVQHALASSAESLSTHLAQGGEALSRQASLQAQNFGIAVQRLEALMSGWQGTLAGTQEMLERMQQATAAVDGAYANFRSTALQLQETSHAVRRASEQLSTAAGAQQTSSEHIVRAAEDVGRSLAVAQASWEEYQKRFETIDTQLANVFQRLDEGLGRYSQNVAEYFRGLEGHMVTATDKLSNVVGALSEDIADLPLEVKNLGAHIERFERAMGNGVRR
ncbi:MAG: anti-phage defense ZorAB system ZorA [Deltaproteobacteria bacterium]|nr:anti-phage defense ZorAB system ZorA [Deltaproteobacteria bacterium]